MDDAAARRIIRQHAETARLLGVDCVPVFRKHADTNAGAVDSYVDDDLDAHPAESDATPHVPELPASLPATTPSASMKRPALSPPPPPKVDVPVSISSPSLSGTTAETQPAASKPIDRVASQAALDALLARYIADAPHKNFVTAHTNIVFGEGDPCARIMFIGEAPGEEEDRTGRPFVGRSGVLLTKMITGMGLSREQVYIANVLKTRPPNNATPTGRECELCKPYLLEQVAIVRPDAIVTLGLPAARVILESQESMTRLRGTWATLRLPGPPISDGRLIPVMPTYHPAFILRAYTPENRGKVWSDLQQVLKRVGLPVPTRSAAGD